MHVMMAIIVTNFLNLFMFFSFVNPTQASAQCGVNCALRVLPLRGCFKELCSLLFQIFNGLFEAFAGFFEAIFGGGVGETDAVVVTECGTLHSGNAGIQQEVECEVGGVLNDGLVVLGGEFGGTCFPNRLLTFGKK